MIAFSRYTAAAALTVALAGCVPASDGPPSSQGAGVSPTPSAVETRLDLERFDAEDGVEVVVADDPNCAGGVPLEKCYVPIFEVNIPPEQGEVEQALNCADDRSQGCDNPVPGDTVTAFCVTQGERLDGFDGLPYNEWYYVEVPINSDEGAGERGFAFGAWFKPVELEDC